jgi:hypothetical protein
MAKSKKRRHEIYAAICSAAFRKRCTDSVYERSLTVAPASRYIVFDQFAARAQQVSRLDIDEAT